LAARVEFVNTYHLSGKEPAARTAALRIRFSSPAYHRQGGAGEHQSDPPLIGSGGFWKFSSSSQELTFFATANRVAVIR
jgi:hypothetical protein